MRKCERLFVGMTLGLLGLTIAACPPSRDTGVLPPREGAVKLEFYLMSKCAYGVQVVNAIAPVLEQLGRDVDFRMEFIGNTLPDGQFKSLQGEPEVQGNIVQLCAKQHSPAQYMDMILCMNKTFRQIPDNWEACAKSSGVNVDAVKACREGSEGKQLLSESFERAAKAGARGSPTIFINGKRYSGGRSTTAFMRGLCDEFEPAKQPASCAELPPPVAVKLTVINDKRCKDCGFRASRFLSRLQMDMPGLTVTQLDWEQEEAKQLFEEKNLNQLPVFIFDSAIEQVEEARRYVMRMKKLGEDRILEIGNFDPRREICDNGIDDTGNGLVDCDDPDCKGTLVCRPEVKGRLELFVMSMCPFGVRAYDAMKEVLDNFGDKLEFVPNYVATEVEPGKFQALNRQPEVDENIRQLCAIHHYGKNYKYMDYILCRNKNIRSTDWQECTGEATGIDTAVIQKCVESGQGTKLLSENIKIANRLQITASPTWIANGKHQFSGVAANDIKNNWCRHNPGTPGCENTLSSTKAPAGSCN